MQQSFQTIRDRCTQSRIFFLGLLRTMATPFWIVNGSPNSWKVGDTAPIATEELYDTAAVVFGGAHEEIRSLILPEQFPRVTFTSSRSTTTRNVNLIVEHQVSITL
jgi:hypothetical protein